MEHKKSSSKVVLFAILGLGLVAFLGGAGYAFMSHETLSHADTVRMVVMMGIVFVSGLGIGLIF